MPGAENAGDVRVISSMGAISLMQLMPDTRATLCIRRRLGRDPQDPRDNVFAGTAYLPEMWDRYGNVAAMLAAYNAGPDRYDEHRSTGRPLPAETRAYVAALLPVVTGAAASEAPDRKSPLPPDWREAPLFAIRPDGMRRCSPYARTACGSPIPGQTIGRFGDARATVPARNRRTAEPQDGSRFVARASNGGSP